MKNDVTVFEGYLNSPYNRYQLAVPTRSVKTLEKRVQKAIEEISKHPKAGIPAMHLMFPWDKQPEHARQWRSGIFMAVLCGRVWHVVPPQVFYCIDLDKLDGYYIRR